MNFIITKIKKYPNIWTFFLCAIIVFSTQFIILQPIIQYRLFNITEDWPFLVFYNSLEPNPLVRLADVWTKYAGLHTTAQIYHIGILSEFLGFDYQHYQIVNVVLKALATLSLFPLVFILFKNRLLAFLSTILFGISAATTGSFLWIVKGGEFLAVLSMNTFFLTYYQAIVKNSKLFIILSSLLFLVTYLLAPPRLFPLFILVPLIEMFWLLRTHKLSSLKSSIIRGVIYFTPAILISSLAPVSTCCPFTSRPLMIFKDIALGNWHNLLDPFAGIGWSVLTNDYWKFFGQLEYETLINLNLYLTFLFKGPVLIFGILTIILSRVLSNQPWKFFMLVFGINFMLEILMFFIASHHNILSENTVARYPGHFVFTKYPTVVALYILTLAFGSFLQWRKIKEKNNLLMALWVGPLFSLSFLLPTWVIMGPLINDWGSTHWYFMIPAMGISLFLAAILVLLYKKLTSIRKLKFKFLSQSLAILVIFVIIFIFYLTQGMDINRGFMAVNPLKIKITSQQALHEKLMEKLDHSATGRNLLIYFDIPGKDADLRITPQYYKEVLVLANFADWVHFRRGLKDGCIAAIDDKEILKKSIRKKDAEIEFLYKGKCLDKDMRANTVFTKDEVIYKFNEFFAFSVVDREFTDIKSQILKELGI